MAPADRGRVGPDSALDVPGRAPRALEPPARGPRGLDPPARALSSLDDLSQGVALLRPLRNDAGTIVDLLYAYANERAGDAAGVPSGVLLGKRVLVALPAFPRDVFDEFVAVLDGGEPMRSVLDYGDAFAGHARFSGSFQISASRLTADALLVVFDDVAARSRARGVERRFAAVLDATSDWVSIADGDQRLVYINEGGRRMVGIGLDEDIAGIPIGEFSTPWAREVVRREALQIALRDGVWRGNLARLHRDGTVIPVSQVIVARKDATGKVDFYATIARDMTRERAAEVALRASEERFRITFEQAPIGASVLGLDGRFVQVNDAFCRAMRRPREELVGMRATDVTHPDDIALTQNAIRRLVAGEGTDLRFEKRYVGPDGEPIWAETSASVLHDDDGLPQFMIAMVQEIGERRVARTLQRSMLTTHLPQIAGVDLAVRYLPGSAEAEVCGDWYDVIPLPDGRVGIAIGDVVGRGIEAAATMSQLRTALRAYAIDGLAPADVVRKLHHLSDHLGEGVGTTLVYLDLELATGLLRYVSAGHLPAVHLDATGAASYLEGGRSTPLGTLWAGVEVPQARRLLAPGECVLLYTDGLVERRDDGIASRLEQLRVATGAAPAELEALLEAVTGALTGDVVRFDDVALLALRYAPSAAPPS